MTNKKITLEDCYNLFKKYGDLNLFVETPYGDKKILWCDITEKNSSVIKVSTENGMTIEGSPNHRVKTNNGRFVALSKLKIGQLIQTKNGNKKVTTISNEGLIEDLFDIEVEEVKQYYSNGIVSHNSTASVDLLLFLFFGSTTKTKTNIEIFNLYRDVDEVQVKGYINIDNEDYIIERKIVRKKSKSGEYNVTNILEFMKINSDGVVENLKGEQRKETEKFIVNSIGTEEDFLSTILTTGNNLEDLIESKPTARGLLLSKFLGLDILKTKEDIAKKMYADWSKKLVSNTNDVQTLEKEVSDFTNLIEKTKQDNVDVNKKISNYNKELIDYENLKEKLFLSRHNNIDEGLININPVLIEKEISDIKQKIEKLEEIIKNVDVNEPSEYYLESEHNDVQKSINDVLVLKETNKKEIENKKKLIIQLETGEFCPTCKRKLEDVDHSDEINSLKQEIEKLQIKDFDKNLTELYVSLEKYKKLKTEYDTYEKNKLIKSKYEIELEQKNTELDNKNEKIKQYDSNKQKLEENKKIDEKILSTKSYIQSLNSDIKIANNSLEKNNNNIETYSEKIKTNKQLITTIKSEEEFVNAFKVYFTIFGKNGISKVIMKNMIPLLNIELYRLLNDSCYFTLELNINDKNEIEFIMIDNETRLVKPLSSGSGYEKTISSLALRSVLTKISSLPKPNIVVMDEVFGKVANNNLEMVGEFFKKIKNYFEHIIVISHNELIRNWSDNIIVIKKENNISKIEY